MTSLLIKSLLAVSAVILVAALVLPPPGLDYIKSTPEQKTRELPQLSTPTALNGDLSISLPAAMVKRGYPPVVWSTSSYFVAHWKDTLSQAYGTGQLYDLQSSLLVTPEMATAGWVLGLPLANQSRDAASLTASSIGASAVSQPISGSNGFFFVNVPKLILSVIAAAALVLGLLPGNRKKEEGGEPSVRRGGGSR